MSHTQNTIASAPVSRLRSAVPQHDRADAFRTPVNELLVQLSAASLAEVMRYAERVSLDRRQVLQERHTPLRYVYFIEGGAASLLAKAGGDRAYVEIRTLGLRDFVGLSPLHGVDTSPHRCAVQVAGHALRLRTADFDRLLRKLPELRTILHSYAHEVFVHSAQLVACNTRHSLRQRLARWLLVASDRLRSDKIEFTHDGLSRAIAVRRAGVTTEMGRLEQAGLVRKTRGAILIVDREGLENASCSCHRMLRATNSPARHSIRAVHEATRGRSSGSGESLDKKRPVVHATA